MNPEAMDVEVLPCPLIVHGLQHILDHFLQSVCCEIVVEMAAKHVLVPDVGFDVVFVAQRVRCTRDNPFIPRMLIRRVTKLWTITFLLPLFVILGFLVILRLLLLIIFIFIFTFPVTFLRISETNVLGHCI